MKQVHALCLAGILATGASASGLESEAEILDAARDGDVDRVAELLALGAPIEARDAKGSTPLP